MARSLLLAGVLLSSLAPATGRATGSAAADFLVNTVTDEIQQSAAVAIDPGGNFVIAWQSEIEGRGDEIRARRFDRRGLARGAEFSVNSEVKGNQVAPSIGIDATGAFAVVWQSFVTNHHVIRARCFDARGVPKGEEIAVDTRPRAGHNAPAVAMSPDGRFVVAWESMIQGSYEIRARRFDAECRAQSGEFPVNTLTEHSQRFPAIALDARGNFVIVWRSNIAGSFELSARRFSAQGVAQGEEFSVNAQTLGDQLAPSVAIDSDGDFVVAWENVLGDALEIRARRFSAQGVAQGDEFPVNPASSGSQFSPAVAMNAAGDFVVVWHSQVGASSEIRGRAFASTGAPLGPELALNTVTRGTQKSTAVALDGDDFVASWHSDAGGSWDVVARLQRFSRKSPPPRAIPSQCCSQSDTGRR
jgi:hypothetical protein